MQLCQTGKRLVLKGPHNEETRFAALEIFASVLKVICTSKKKKWVKPLFNEALHAVATQM